MEILEVMKLRHSVRKYELKEIEEEKKMLISNYINDINKESGFSIQAFFDEPKCFSDFMSKNRGFENVTNYIAIIGNKTIDEERCGYYGEKLVLFLQSIGINTCWVALTHGKINTKINKGEKLFIVISMGYGKNQGVEHRNKDINSMYRCDKQDDVFMLGMQAAMLAPTAINQQKFYFEYENGQVNLIQLMGPCARIDLGIVRYHFEVVTGMKVNIDG